MRTARNRWNAPDSTHSRREQKRSARSAVNSARCGDPAGFQGFGYGEVGNQVFRSLLLCVAPRRRFREVLNELWHSAGDQLASIGRSVFRSEPPPRHVREILIELLQSVTDRLVSTDRVDWPSVVDRLEKARVMAADEDDLSASVVSAANLLFDCEQKAVDVKGIQAALGKLDVSKGWESGLGSHLLRKGPDVAVDSDTAMGFSAIAWKNFTLYFASPLGYGVDDRSLEQLWADLRKGYKKIPLGELDIADPTGNSSAWVTDDDADGTTLLKSADPTVDVYDQLGLNWTKFAEKDGKTRAVLLCCPLQIRKHAASSLHCPNSVDGWNNLFFVPRTPVKGATWPDHGSRAARPTSDAPTLPEAVHGPAKASRESVNTLPLDYEINVGDRSAEYGDAAMQRAIDRLRRKVVVP